MDAFVNVATDMGEFIRLQQQWHVPDDTVSIMVPVVVLVIVMVVLATKFQLK